MQIHARKLLTLMTLASFLGGCASINSVSLTPVPAQRSQPVKAQVSKFIILGFNFDNDFVDPLIQDLKGQCPNGVISGILTKDETISYFLAFRKVVTATGFCNTATKTVAKSSQPRRPSNTAENTVEE